jgi:DNA mismatch repair protein MutS2
MRIIEIENSKRKKATIKESKAIEKKRGYQEVTVIEEIRKEKKEKN